jgi:xanthine dehydrogenase YagR molybdenum-binding subunit
VRIDEQPHDTELRADRDDLYTPEKVNPNYESDTRRATWTPSWPRAR